MRLSNDKRKQLTQMEITMTQRRYQALADNPYLGQECRIVRAFINLEGRQSYALKMAQQTVAISPDRQLLIDLAKDRHMKLIETQN